ncbi:MAG: hypothetical protein H0X33_03420 [Taibaiella sp.]|nr:hypothetical protein [Taibaiella sp.]
MAKLHSFEVVNAVGDKTVTYLLIGLIYEAEKPDTKEGKQYVPGSKQ